MKIHLRKIIALVLFAIPAWAMATVPGDSVGTKIINGKAYILYKIAKGDNLSQISRSYGVSVASLEELNEVQGGNIQVGQVILVPSRSASSNMSLRDLANSKPAEPAPLSKPVSQPAPAPSPSPAVEQNPVSMQDGRKQHTVAKGETLYAVSRKYGVSVGQIKEWNGMTQDGINEGQKLWVSADKATAQVKPEQMKPVEQPQVKEEKPAVVEQKQENPASKPESKTETKLEVVETPSKPVAEPKIKSNGVHIVKSGETLFGIARTYGMDVSELRRLNRLESTNVAIGQSLKVKAEQEPNENQGMGLAEMMETVGDTAPKLEAFPDLRVLTAPESTKIPSTATVTTYRDKSTGKDFKRVEEMGSVGNIEDYSTDQTRFYAFHRSLPVGSYIRVDYPAKGQSILVEVINQLPEKDPFTIRLSAKCLDYLMIREKGVEVKLRYVIPLGQ